MNASIDQLKMLIADTIKHQVRGRASWDCLGVLWRKKILYKSLLKLRVCAYISKYVYSVSKF